MKQKRFYSYALATSLLISSFGGLVNVSAATYQDAEEVKAQEEALGRETQEKLITMLQSFDENKEYLNREEFIKIHYKTMKGENLWKKKKKQSWI